MPTENPEEQSSIVSALWSVALVGALLTLASPILFDKSVVISVAAGGALAVGNLWAIARLVRNFLLPGPRLPWVTVAMLKIAILFLFVIVLVASSFVKILPLLMGYGALPLGIVVAQLKSPKVARGEG